MLGYDAEYYYKSCVIDVCSNKDLPKLQQTVTFNSYEALATKCEEFGLLIEWRSRMHCSIQCPHDKVYSERTNVCQPTCTNPTPVCTHEYTEGCICKPGTILSGTKCVPITSCGCMYNGIYRMVGTDLLLTDCSETVRCVSMNKIEKQPGCSENSMCSVTGGARHCICKEGYEMVHGKCKGVVVPPSLPEDVNINLDSSVMQHFVSVFAAYLKETPIKTLKTSFPEHCAQVCLKDKTCKSFNFNKLKERCQLFSKNAEDRTLQSNDCQYDVYYQRIGLKYIFIRGAEIFSSTNLKTYKGVKTLEQCKRKCRLQGYKSMEYMKSENICRITMSSWRESDLIGSARWSYYEML